MNPPLTAELNEHLSVKLYEDSRPNYLETAPLQKGLVLVLNGKELIEEGMGFGAPVVLFENRTYFSRSAETSVTQIGNSKILTKKFIFDTILRKKIGDAFYINDYLYSYYHKWFQKIYTEHKGFALISTKLIELSRRIGVATEFQKVTSIGNVTVKYSCLTDSISIEVLSQLQRGYREVAVLNEQGASIFRKYSDTDGLTLLDTQIGAWEVVEAGEASLSHIDGSVSFSLPNHRKSRFFRGREKIDDQYSWVGFCYYLAPEVSMFQYLIKLKTG
ncbi:hypothetical protein GX563_07515 [Candidatus Bathyarchaeota archaeon]|nr:hypothetical protein [Candidatus Bathyarchaeota archaeon]